MRNFFYLFAIAAVMLGMASCGDGNNTDVIGCNMFGYYWSATPSDASTVYKFDFNSYQLRWQYNNYRFLGRSVRLVQDIN